MTFGGTTYKVSGIPDGKRKKEEVWIGCSNAHIPLSAPETSWVQCNTCHTRGAAVTLAQKACFVVLSPCPPPLNNYAAANLVFKQKENCQLSSQIRQSLPYHSQVAKRCWASPRLFSFSACNEWLDLHRLCGKNREPNRATLPLLSAFWFCQHNRADRTHGTVWKLSLWGFPCIWWAWTFYPGLTTNSSSRHSRLHSKHRFIRAPWTHCLPKEMFKSCAEHNLIVPSSPQAMQATSCATTRWWGWSREKCTSLMKWRAAAFSMLSPTTLTVPWSLA